MHIILARKSNFIMPDYNTSTVAVEDCLGFGTYRLKPATARNAVTQALRYTDITHIDTALMYNNDDVVKEVVDASKKSASVVVTTKIKINTRLYKDLISKGE